MMKRLITLLACLALVTALVPATASAQFFTEDHFKVYRTLTPYPFPGPVLLQDQFGEFVAHDLWLDHFATPVSKNGEPILDPVRHLTWWSILHPQGTWDVWLENQFGPQRWQVREGRYLLVPAAKNQPQTLMPHNHYQCYAATGQPVMVPVVLQDQFGTVQVVAAEPALFCNPVVKTDPTGMVYPIEDPQMHLACYRIDPPMPHTITAIAFDQFGTWDVVLVDHEWLCVPSLKTQAVPAGPSTWGQIKARYRD